LPGNRLYDISKDSHQDNNVAAQYPEIAQQLSAHYDKWYSEARPLFEKPLFRLNGPVFKCKENVITNSGGVWVEKSKFV
jgi:hypothetical protein